MKPRVSVIIPCFNVENLVGDCLDSILNQTIGIDKIEIILVDDCSTDNTVEVLKKYDEKYPEVFKLVLLDVNGRQGRARNIGLEYAEGDYISFVDSDDYIREDMYECLIKFADANDLDLIQFRHKGVFEKGTQEEKSVPDFKIYEYCENRKSYLLDSRVLNESCWQKFYKRSLIESASIRFAEDVAYEEPLFTYPLKYYVNKIAVTEEPLYYYRLNEQGTTAKHMEDPSKMTEHLYVQNLLYTRMKNESFYNEYKSEIDLYFIHSFFVSPFYFYTARNQVMGLGFFKYMCEKLLEELPEYYKNPYLEDESLKDEVKLLKLIEDNNTLNDELMTQKILEMQRLLV